MFDNFGFYKIRIEKYHYTDNRKGSPMNYIACMLKGTARIISAQDSLQIKEGDIFFIPINLPYESYWYGNDKIEFLSYGFSNIDIKEKLNFNLQIIDCDENIKNSILKIPTEGTSLSCETLCAFYGVLSKLIPFLNKNRHYSKKDEILDKARKYINEHTDCSVAEAAKKCFVSEPYLYMIFREKLGYTPNNYRLKVKCEKGIEYLLTTDRTVEEISDSVGFSSASHFRRTLKSLEGVTPKEIRKKRGF